MTDTGIAVRYARALYETAAEQGTAAEMAEDMAAMEQILAEVPQIRSYCLRERERHTAELEFIDIAFVPYVGELTGRLLHMAVLNGRLAAIPFIPQAYREIAERAAGTVHVVVEVAQEPEPGLLERIEAKMRGRTGREIRLELRVTPEIQGGIRISWDSRLIDMSVSARLRQMRRWIKAE